MTQARDAESLLRDFYSRSRAAGEGWVQYSLTVRQVNYVMGIATYTNVGGESHKVEGTFETRDGHLRHFTVKTFPNGAGMFQVVVGVDPDPLPESHVPSNSERWNAEVVEPVQAPAPRREAIAHVEPDQLPRGTFTVTLNSGDRRTIKIGRPVHQVEEFRGWTFFKFLSGSDNTSSYTNFAFQKAGETAVQLKARYNDDTVLVAALRGLLNAEGTQRHEWGVAFAQESGNCYVCGRTLTVPASIYSGIGPVCAGNTGAPYGDPNDDFAEDMSDPEYDEELEAAANMAHTEAGGEAEAEINDDVVARETDAEIEALAAAQDHREAVQSHAANVAAYGNAGGVEAPEPYSNPQDDEPDQEDLIGDTFEPVTKGIWTESEPCQFFTEASNLRPCAERHCPGCGDDINRLVYNSYVSETDLEGELVSTSYGHACGATLVLLND